MPGFCLHVDRDGGSSPADGDFTAMLDSLVPLESYDSEPLLERDGIALGRTSYPSYPVEAFETDGYWIYLEGYIYDHPDVREAVTSLAPRLLSRDTDTDALAEWLLGTDGEFVLCVLDKGSGDLAVLNDALGRLPVYYYMDDAGMLLAREVRFVLEGVPDLRFDRIGVAQQLLFKFPIGDRTLWEGVRRLEPSTLVTLRRSGDVAFTDLHTFVVDGRAHADRSIEENAENLASLYVRGCRNRSRRPGRNVVSLSGGHDSRSIAAGFHAGDLPFVAATFAKEDGNTAADVEVARDLAEALDVEWDRYDLSPGHDLERFDRLLRLKSGLNAVSMGFILEFFEDLQRRYGRDLTYFTGDGGRKTLANQAPVRSLDTLEDLVSSIVTTNKVFPLDRVAELTGVSESEVLDSIRAVVSTYPEEDFDDRYAHFVIYERGFNWLSEGEDRNRYYFWSTSPHYSTQFFTYAMGVPQEQKSHMNLFREFLASMWPRAIEFDHSNWGTPITSPRYRLIMHVLDVLERYPALWDAVGVVYRGEIGYEYPEAIHSVLARQVDRCDAVSRVFSREALGEVVDDRSSCNSKQIFQLLTITSAIDALHCGNSISERREPVPAT